MFNNEKAWGQTCATFIGSYGKTCLPGEEHSSSLLLRSCLTFLSVRMVFVVHYFWLYFWLSQPFQAESLGLTQRFLLRPCFGALGQ